MDFEIRNVKNVYENIVVEFSNSRHCKWDWVEDFINKMPPKSIMLDVGCGNGRNMTNTNHNFYGIDNCTKFIEIAQQRNLNVILSDMTVLPFNDNYFDGIIMIASFHHLSTIERRIKCLDEINRVLKNTGQVLLSVWSINQSHNNKLNNKFHYGDNLVPWISHKQNIQVNRYYYIFKMDELYNILLKHFIISDHYLKHGNEVFILKKIIDNPM